MWKSFKNDDSVYLFKLSKENGIKIYITDLKSLWGQSLSKDEILGLFQVLNPLFDVKIDEAFEEVCNLIENIPILKDIIFNKNNTCIELNLKDTKGQYNVLFNLNLKEESQENFLKEFTIPLMQTTKLLEDQLRVLCNIIQRKDRELEEYKLEKGPISRNDLVTEEFDESKLEESKTQFEQSFWETFEEKYGTVNTQLQEVPTQPWNNVKRKRTIISSKTIKKHGRGIQYD